MGFEGGGEWVEMLPIKRRFRFARARRVWKGIEAPVGQQGDGTMRRAECLKGLHDVVERIGWKGGMR